MVTLLHPPYHAPLFEPYVGKTRTRLRYFTGHRSLYPQELHAIMREMGYAAPSKEAWSTLGDMREHDYLQGLANARWVFDIEHKPSAGQLVAEASLLGVPAFSGAARPNAELLLPEELRLSPNLSKAEVLSAVKAIVGYYDASPSAYASLCEGLHRRAAERLRPPTADSLFRAAVRCC